jgi:hypothetical protein
LVYFKKVWKTSCASSTGIENWKAKKKLENNSIQRCTVIFRKRRIQDTSTKIDS